MYYHYYQHTPTSLILIKCKYKITMSSLVFNFHQGPRYIPIHKLDKVKKLDDVEYTLYYNTD